MIVLFSLRSIDPIIYGDGKQTRDFTYIDDIIDGTLKASEINDAEGEIFNLGGGSRTSLIRINEMLLKLTCKEDIVPIYEDSKIGDVHDTYANISKSRKILGYNPNMSIKEGLKQFVDWFKSRARARAKVALL